MLIISVTHFFAAELISYSELNSFMSCLGELFVGVEKPHMLWIIYGTTPFHVILMHTPERSCHPFAVFLPGDRVPPAPSSTSIFFSSWKTNQRLLYGQLCSPIINWICRIVSIGTCARKNCVRNSHHRWTWGIMGIVICGDWMGELLPIKFACPEILKGVGSVSRGCWFMSKSTVLSCHYGFTQSDQDHWLFIAHSQLVLGDSMNGKQILFYLQINNPMGNNTLDMSSRNME